MAVCEENAAMDVTVASIAPILAKYKAGYCLAGTKGYPSKYQEDAIGLTTS